MKILLATDGKTLESKIAKEALEKCVNNELEELKNPTLKRSIEDH